MHRDAQHCNWHVYAVTLLQYSCCLTVVVGLIVLLIAVYCMQSFVVLSTLYNYCWREVQCVLIHLLIVVATHCYMLQ
jgi:hypothetical protein